MFRQVAEGRRPTQNMVLLQFCFSWFSYYLQLC